MTDYEDKDDWAPIFAEKHDRPEERHGNKEDPFRHLTPNERKAVFVWVIITTFPDRYHKGAIAQHLLWCLKIFNTA